MRALRFLTAAILATCELCVISGCGGSGDRLATVPAAGKVTVDGQAFGPGTIELMPTTTEGSRMARAKVGSDGTFRLGSYSEEDGAVPGSYYVRLTPQSSDPHMPGISLALEQTKITIAPEGSKDLSLDLKKDKKAVAGLKYQPLTTGASTKL